MALLPPRIARSAHRVLATAPSQAPSALPQTCLAAQRHKGPTGRRHSSSKASCPPNNDGKNAPAAKPDAAAEGASANVRPAKRMGRTKRNNSSGERQLESHEEGKKREEAEKFAGLPSVPGVQHLHSGGMFMDPRL